MIRAGESNGACLDKRAARSFRHWDPIRPAHAFVLSLGQLEIYSTLYVCVTSFVPISTSMSIDSSCERLIVQNRRRKGRGASCEGAERYRWQIHRSSAVSYRILVGYGIVAHTFVLSMDTRHHYVLYFILDAQFA